MTFAKGCGQRSGRSFKMTTPMNLISVKHYSKEWPRLEFQTIFGSFSLFCKISGVKILANLPILPPQEGVICGKIHSTGCLLIDKKII